jgi:hypothetical protein
MYRICIICLLCFIPGLILAQDNASELENLRKQIAIQRQQIEEQKAKLEKQLQDIEVQQHTLDQLVAKTAGQQQSVSPNSSTEAKTASTPAPAAPKTDVEGKPFSPLAFHIGGADFTPGGFLDLSSIWRSTNVGSGVATSFNTIPANNSAAGKLSESRFSMQNTRFTMKVTERPFKNVVTTGYFEMDFSGTLPGAGYVTGNGVSFRLRQGYINVQIGKFEILGGQAWSLITPNREGTSPAPSDIFLGGGQDSAYMAGLVFVRQSQIRATYHFTPKWALAFSAENPQQYVTGATTLPAAFISQFDNGVDKSSIANPRPDFAAKLALDTKIGKLPIHFDIGGISRQFRTLAPNGVRHSAQGVGGTMTLILEPIKNFRWILTAFHSSGGGRFIMGMGPDVVVAPDGAISPVHSTSGITGLEYRIRPASQLFAYYSGAYFSRNYITVSPNNYIGFGYPGSAGTSNRQIQEATAGYIHIFWKNQNFGSLQAIGQYAFVSRTPWYAASQADAEMHTHMVFTGLRFTIP